MPDWSAWTPSIVMLALGASGGWFALTRIRQAAAEAESTAGTTHPEAPGGLSAGSDPENRRETLLARKESLFEQIRAIDADRSKIGPDGEAPLREALVHETAEVLRRLDALGPAAPRRRAPLAWVALFAILGGLGLFLAANATPRPKTGAAESNETEGMGNASATGEAMGSATGGSGESADLGVDPNDLAALDRAAHDAIYKQDLAKAMRMLDAARKIAPDDPEVLTHLAALRALVGMDDKAGQSLTQALTAKPDLAEAMLWMAVVSWHKGDGAAAQEWLAKTRKAAPADSDIARFADQVEVEMAQPAEDRKVPAGGGASGSALPPGHP